MDGCIQSCETDEALYHESLVHPVLSSTPSPKRVMIVGGGEGATLREVVKWPQVESIDMYEWDQEVIQLFQKVYPQWGKGAWKDPRLQIHTNNIFEVIMKKPLEPYDCIIIDLFDPEEENRLQWSYLFEYLSAWAAPHAIIVMYAGMINPDIDLKDKTQPYQMLCHMISQQIKDKDISPYFIPMKSFMGDAVFIMLLDSIKNNPIQNALINAVKC
jgi:spermidine synthase